MQQQMPITYLSLPADQQKAIEQTYDAGQHLYFIHSKEHNLVKIGVAKYPHKRLAAMQTGSPTPLELIYVVPFGGYALEHKLHKQFEGLRTIGEWFKYDAPIKTFIDKIQNITQEVGLEWNLLTHQLKT